MKCWAFFIVFLKKMETTGLWFYGTLEVEWNSNRHLNLTNSWHSFRIASSVLSFTQLHPHCKYPVNVLGMSKTVLSRPEGWRLPLGLSASRTISQETSFPETRQRSSQQPSFTGQVTITPIRLQQLQRTSTATVEDVLQLRAPQSLPVVEQCSQQTLEDPADISIQIRIGPQAEAWINTNINFPLKESIVSGPNTLQITTQVLG